MDLNPGIKAKKVNKPCLKIIFQKLEGAAVLEIMCHYNEKSRHTLGELTDKISSNFKSPSLADNLRRIGVGQICQFIYTIGLCIPHVVNLEKGLLSLIS